MFFICVSCFASIAIERQPLMGRMVPFSESSPDMMKFLMDSCDMISSQISIAIAMGRSKAAPSFLRAAGARFTVIGRSGNANPMFLSAARTLSLLSFTEASGKPTIEKCGTPFVCISTSTSTG